MIATLMSIVDNVEEQKRLAHQSQVFLSMTQNVFSSLREYIYKALKVGQKQATLPSQMVDRIWFYHKISIAIFWTYARDISHLFLSSF